MTVQTGLNVFERREKKKSSGKRKTEKPTPPVNAC
jgi:hypothetical protein